MGIPLMINVNSFHNVVLQQETHFMSIEKYYKLIKTLIMRLGLKRLGKKKGEVFSQVLCNVSNLNSDIQIFLCCRQM